MKKEIIKTEMKVKDNLVRVMRVGDIDYISLTDLAKYQNEDDPSGVIRNWMSNKNSFDFYNLWEELHNENFNSVESHRIKIDEVGYNRFTMTPNRWKKDFNAIGIIPSSGKYSIGTFAHPDIAFEFASWLNTEFKLYLITEFERLKKNESYQNKINWSVRRELAKTNYRIHTDSIKENIIPTLTENQKQYVYANEADILNVALFGMTAKEWKDKNPNLDGNMQEYFGNDFENALNKAVKRVGSRELGDSLDIHIIFLPKLNPSKFSIKHDEPKRGGDAYIYVIAE